MSAVSDIARILAAFRAQHDWQPGWKWDPHAGVYVESAADVVVGSQVEGKYHPEAKCQAVAAALPGGPLARDKCRCATCLQELA